MSKKAKSTLPSELNENWGSNYMMDGFDFDMDYGAGVADPKGKELLPQPPQSGFAKLPGGVIVGEESDDDFDLEVDEGEWMYDDEGLDLLSLGITDSEDLEGLPSLEEVAKQASATMLVDNSDRSDAGIVDLTWLSQAYQDQDRFPHNQYTMVPELQECWGDRTDGIYRIDLRDRDEIQYQDAQQGPEDDDILNRDKLAKVMQSAMRRSASGAPLKKVLSDVRGQVHDHEVPKIVSALQALRAEHGLAGNVYIRASAYPGLHHGKWRKQLAKAAKKAKYLIACPGEDCGGCAKATGLKVVKSPKDIDWDWVYSKYAPELIQTGRLATKSKKASNKMETLRRAFLAEEVAPKTHIESVKPVHVTPSERVSAKKAKQAFDAYEKPEQEKITLEAKHEARLRAQVTRRVQSWKQAGLISKKQAKALLGMDIPAKELLTRAASLIVRRNDENTYEGQGLGLNKAASIGFSEAQEVLSKFKVDTRATKKVRKRASSQAERWALQAMNEGFAGQELDDLIARKFASRTASSQLVQIRRKHEGLAGHLYVDAAAYASPEGVSGCEEGGRRHRANPIKYVMAMDRCGSCVHRNVHNKCAKYNKQLTTQVPHPDPESYQREMIAAKNETDAEATVNLFQLNDIQRDLSPGEEYGLHNAALDNVDIKDDEPPATLDGVMFGGWEIE